MHKKSSVGSFSSVICIFGSMSKPEPGLWMTPCLWCLFLFYMHVHFPCCCHAVQLCVGLLDTLNLYLPPSLCFLKNCFMAPVGETVRKDPRWQQLLLVLPRPGSTWSQGTLFVPCCSMNRLHFVCCTPPGFPGEGSKDWLEYMPLYAMLLPSYRGEFATTTRHSAHLYLFPKLDHYFSSHHLTKGGSNALGMGRHRARWHCWDLCNYSLGGKPGMERAVLDNWPHLILFLPTCMNFGPYS